MASYNNVSVSGTAWINLNTASGAAVGTAINIQNTGMGSVLVTEQTATPTTENGGVLYPPHFGDLSKAVVDSGSEVIWVKSIGSQSTILRVYE